MLRVQTYCELSTSTFSVDGEVQMQRGDVPLSDWLKQLYAHLDMSYPKFHKMDALCKAGLLCGEALVGRFEPSRLENLAVVLNNSVSSLDTDVRHEETLAAEGPSPAIFVYTLPNIVIGELAIKHKIYGENMFLVSDAPSEDMLETYLLSLIRSGKCEEVLTGWLDVYDDQISAIFMVVSEATEGQLFQDVFGRARALEIR